MYHIRQNAETSVRNLLKDVARRAGSNILSAIDYLDDGSPVSYSLLLTNPVFKQRSRLHSKLKLTKPRVLLY